MEYAHYQLSFADRNEQYIYNELELFKLSVGTHLHSQFLLSLNWV